MGKLLRLGLFIFARPPHHPAAAERPCRSWGNFGFKCCRVKCWLRRLRRRAARRACARSNEGSDFLCFHTIGTLKLDILEFRTKLIREYRP